MNEGPYNRTGWHRHKDIWEVVYYIKGRGIVFFGERAISFQPGTLVVTPPGLIHNEKSSRPWTSVYFRTRQLRGLEDVSVLVDTPGRPLLRIMDLLCDEYLKQETGWESVTDALLSAFIVRAGSTGGARSDTVVEELRGLLSENIPHRGFQLKNAVDSFPVSHVTLYNRFKKITGRSPHQYLIDLRLAEGARLLRASRLSVREIADRSGFPDPFHFSKIFRSKTGLSPKQFRLGKKQVQ
ncbi:MAG: helix-turn-helix domain-containing protein [Spirochaetia bacterium]|nr:helix-turn-helix domain-containing protein [Spirochaetia bacterium]